MSRRRRWVAASGWSVCLAGWSSQYSPWERYALSNRCFLRTSGTTGLPKLIHRDGQSLDAVARNVANATQLTPHDRVLAIIPQYHSYGIENVLLAPLWAGAAIHVCDAFDPATVLTQWREGGVTVMPAVPFVFEVMAGAGPGGDRHSVRLVYSAGGPLPTGVFQAFEDKYGLRIGQLYGATEIGSVTFNEPGKPGFDPQSVGLPLEGVEVRIVDSEDPLCILSTNQEGQIAVRAPSMLSRYLETSDEPRIDGFFLTGDLGYLDARGALKITGRLKLLIDVGGMKVNPLEIETVMADHPAVRECAVVPIAQSATVSRVKAVIVPHPGRQVSTEQLRQFARERLAGYKVPRVFELREALPRTALGKVQRRALMEASG
jgi:long-chain acyl-CoA synthetase